MHRALLLVVAGACCLLPATTQFDTPLRHADRGPGLPPSAPRLAIEITPGQVTVSGTSAGASHDAALNAILERDYRQASKAYSPRFAVLPPPWWHSVSERLLATLAASNSVHATLDERRLSVRGTAMATATWPRELDRLGASLPGDLGYDVDLKLLRQASADPCTAWLQSLDVDELEFDRDSAALTRSAVSVLEPVVEYLVVCADRRLTVVGHTDGSGNAGYNRALAGRRATAVVAYLESRDIDAARLHAVGAGADEPVARNDTAWGRRLNRRIELRAGPR